MSVRAYLIGVSVRAYLIGVSVRAYLPQSLKLFCLCVLECFHCHAARFFFCTHAHTCLRALSRKSACSEREMDAKPNLARATSYTLILHKTVSPRSCRSAAEAKRELRRSGCDARPAAATPPWCRYARAALCTERNSVSQRSCQASKAPNDRNLAQVSTPCGDRGDDWY